MKKQDPAEKPCAKKLIRACRRGLTFWHRAFLRGFIMFSFFLLARTAFAQVFISEIMYDPQGGDTGHEWVEVVNQGSTSVDLAHSKFVEGGSSHVLVPTQGGASLLSGAYAIIADNAQTFLSDHAGFSGVILDSSFSLKNTGETVAFKMPDGTVSDTVVYTSTMGGAGDGNSLQKIDSMWRGAAPTPGVGNSSVSSVATLTVSNTSAVAAAPFSNAASFPVEPQIIADAGTSVRTVSTGAPIVFSGRVFGLKKEPIDNARLAWSFGDGARGEGTSVSHTYYYPGEYIAVLDAASGYFSASDRVVVRVAAPLVSLQTGGDTTRSFVSIENRGADEIDFSFWQVVSGGKTFIIPQNTILGARKILTLAEEVSGLSTPAGSTAFLNFPNGARVPVQSAATSTAPTTTISKVTSYEPVKKVASAIVEPRRLVASSHNQEASVLDTLSSSTPVLPQKEDALWPWYIGAAFLGVLALLGIRFARGQEEKNTISAEDFEIIEEIDDEEPH